MTASVWDYDAVPYDDTGDWGNSQEEVVLEEDCDGNSLPAKRGRKAQTPKAPPKAVVVLLSDSGDDGEVSDGDLSDCSLDCDLALGERKAKARRIQDDVLGDEDGKAGACSSAMAATPAVPAPPHAAHADAAPMGSAARKAIEESRKLQQRMVALQGDSLEDVEAEPVPEACVRRALSLRRPILTGLGVAGAGGAAEDDDGGAEGAGPSSLGAGKAADADGDVKLTIVCQCRDGEVPIKLRPTDPLSKLQRAFLHAAVDRGWLSAPDPPPPGFRVVFDGEKIGGQETPEDLGMEDKEKVDVMWKQ